MTHRLELLIQAQDLVKVYQRSTHFRYVYHYITDGKLPSGAKAQACIQAEALNYMVNNTFLFRIDTRKVSHSRKIRTHNFSYVSQFFVSSTSRTLQNSYDN